MTAPQPVRGSLDERRGAALGVREVAVSVSVGAPADLSALLVTEQLKVRSDADFVFFNQPEGPGVRLRDSTGGQQLVLSLDQVPADIAKIRTVITLADASSIFGAIAAPTAIISDGNGNP